MVGKGTGKRDRNRENKKKKKTRTLIASFMYYFGFILKKKKCFITAGFADRPFGS